jgi:hypothetical protein
MQSSVSASRRMGWINRVPAGDILRLVPAGDREDDNHESQPSSPVPAEREDLPYTVEIWNETGAAVEQVVAVTASASIGYAAYYAATREFPDRQITLRHKNSIVARWHGPKH